MTPEVDGDDLIPVLIGHVEQHPVTGDTGVVDHDVQPTQPFGAGDHLIGGGTQADIPGHRDGLRSGRRDLVAHIGVVQRLRHVIDDDRRAGTSQPDGFGAAQSGRGTGHHRDASGQVEVARSRGVRSHG